MNREPTVFYILRFLLVLGVFAFMGMLYWSSALIEVQLKDVKFSLAQIKNDIFTLRTVLTQTQKELIDKNAEYKSTSQILFNNEKQPAHAYSQSQNLLKEDLFYKNTLPQLLSPDFIPQGIRREATFGKPEHLHPFSGWGQTFTWHSLCCGAVAKYETGKFTSFSPDMALSMELRENAEGQSEYWVFLRKDLYWLPLKQEFFNDSLQLAPQFLHKHPVTAADFKFFLDAVHNTSISEAGASMYRSIYKDIEEIQVIDDYTFIVRWKTAQVEEDGKIYTRTQYKSKALTASLRPLASFVYKYFANGEKIVENDNDPNTYRTNPIWAQNFSNHWAKNIIPSCGAWEFDGMNDQEIRFKRNPDFYHSYAALTEGIEYKFKSSADAIWEEFKMGTIDSFEIPAYQLTEYERFLQSPAYKKQESQGLKINRLDYVQSSYTYIGWNEARPLFNSQKVRQALTLAVDRKRIIRQNLNGMGIQTTGPFFIYSSAYDNQIQPYVYDPEKALQLLHEEGWYDSDGDGILNKTINGKEVSFSFTLIYYVKSQTSKNVCEYIAGALKEIGILCKINGVEMADLSAIFEDKNFDAYCMAWGLPPPPEDPRQIWYSVDPKEKGSSNAINFSNKRIDTIINQLDYEYDTEKRLALYHEFDRIIHEEAPYLFLFVPKIVFLYRDYLKNVFIPVDREDLIPGADMAEPQMQLVWLKENIN